MTDQAPQQPNDPARQQWEGVYAGATEGQLPWFSDVVDPEFLRELQRSGLRPEDGPCLDIGTGPGTTARELARLGYHVTAVDVAPSAIDMARRRAGDVADRITWRVDNITTTEMAGPFAFAHDRGCFHTLDDADRARYVPQLARLIRPGGRLFLKAFSKKQPGDWGPRRYAIEEIERLFAPAFTMVHSEETIFEGTLEPHPAAIFCVLLRSA